MLGVSNAVGEVLGKGIGRVAVIVEAVSDESEFRRRLGTFSLHFLVGGVNHSWSLSEY
jgi:hypothetical protein